MNFENKGQRIAIFSGTKPKVTQSGCPYCGKPVAHCSLNRHYKICQYKDADKILCIQKDPKGIYNYLTDFTIKTNDTLQQTVDPRERTNLFVTGMSKSGKSTYINNFAKQFRKAYPKANIFCFSFLEEDETLDVKALKRIKLDQEFLDIPNEELFSEMGDSLCIFDDISIIPNKQVLAKVQSILDMALQVGRHSGKNGISVAYSTHLGANNRETKTILCEATTTTIFYSISGRNLEYLLKNYFSLSPTDIKRVKKLLTDFRWITITKSFPPICFWEKGAFVLTK